MQLVSKITLATFYFNKHLTIKVLSYIASNYHNIIGKYFPRLKAREISCKISETPKIFPMLFSVPCYNN